MISEVISSKSSLSNISSQPVCQSCISVEISSLRSFKSTLDKRQKTRTKFEPKIGKLSYALGRYQKLSRCLIPINENYYLILTIDFEETNFDKIIIEKIIPLIKKEKFFIR